MNEEDFYLEDLKAKFTKIDFSKYYLSYSGGRDSHFLYWFIKEVLKDDIIKIVSVNTLLEHKEILERINKYSDVVLLPNKKHIEIKRSFGIPCFTKNQDKYIDRYQRGLRTKDVLNKVYGLNTKYGLSKNARSLLLSGKLHKISPLCCKYIKKDPLNKFEKKNKLFPIVGLRKSEGLIRSNIKSCLHKNNKFTPIFDLSDDLLKKIEIKYKIPVPEIYKTISRTGCFGCPYSHNIQKELNLLSDAQRKFIFNYFRESYVIKGIQERNLNNF